MKCLLRAEINIVSESVELIALELESLANTIRGSCRLGEPEGQEKFSEPFIKLRKKTPAFTRGMNFAGLSGVNPRDKPYWLRCEISR